MTLITLSGDITAAFSHLSQCRPSHSLWIETFNIAQVTFLEIEVEDCLTCSYLRQRIKDNTPSTNVDLSIHERGARTKATFRHRRHILPATLFSGESLGGREWTITIPTNHWSMIKNWKKNRRQRSNKISVFSTSVSRGKCKTLIQRIETGTARTGEKNGMELLELRLCSATRNSTPFCNVSKRVRGPRQQCGQKWIWLKMN